ncbi:hypothetical protein ACET3Z_012167 [Daucus carota]
MSNVSGQSAATLLKGDEKLGGRKAQAGESITSKLGIEDCTFLYYVDCTQGICYCHLSSVTASEGCEQVSDMKAQSRDTFNPNGN